MYRQAPMRKPNRKYIPVAAASCFFVLSAALYGSWRVSPRQQAERAVREYYTYSAEKPVPDYLRGEEGAQRVFVRGVELEEDPSSDGTETGQGSSYRYRAEYTVALEKGNHTVTPLIEKTASGRVVTGENRKQWTVAEMLPAEIS